MTYDASNPINAPVFLQAKRGRDGEWHIETGFAKDKEWQRHPMDLVRRYLATGRKVGILTGRRSGHFTIDVDADKGGLETFAALEAEHGSWGEETNKVYTPHGGFHLNFAAPPDFEVSNSVSLLFGPGIDVRGHGGFRVAPPTEGYREDNPDVGYHKAADWVLDRLRAHTEKVDGGAVRRSEPREDVPKVTDPPACCSAVARAEVAAVVDAMARLAALGEHESCEVFGKESGWDEGYMRCAARLIEVARWPHTRFSLSRAEKIFFEHAPDAERNFDPNHKWNRGEIEAREFYRGEQHRLIEHVAVLPKVSPDVDPLEGDEASAFSDARLAEKIAKEFEAEGHPIVYTTALGWLRWNGRRWKPTNPAMIRGKIMMYAKNWLAALIAENAPMEFKGKVLALMNNSKADRLVKTLEALRQAEAEEFDAHPDLLNCFNGVVDLRTGELLPHDPALRMTKITRAAYRPEMRGKSADWEKAKQALEPETREYLLGRLGQAATGHTPTDDKVVFNSGVGGNGKSTFLEPVRRCLGDYAAMVPDKLLLANPSDHPTELMSLRGLRLAIIEELPEAGRLNTQRLKKVIGTESITARVVYKDNVSFAPTHALFVNTNHDPVVSETDHGTWRRLEKVPFARKYRKGHIDATLRQRVKRPEALEAALADLVFFAGRWYANGRVMELPSEAVVEATKTWQSDSDLLFGFFTDQLAVDRSGPGISCVDFLDAFNDWNPSPNEWGEALMGRRLAANENLPMRFVKAKRRKHLARNNRLVTEKNPIWVWAGVRWSDD